MRRAVFALLLATAYVTLEAASFFIEIEAQPPVGVNKSCVSGVCVFIGKRVSSQNDLG